MGPLLQIFCKNLENYGLFSAQPDPVKLPANIVSIVRCQPISGGNMGV